GVKEFESSVDQCTAKNRKRRKTPAVEEKPTAFHIRGSDASQTRKPFARDCERFQHAELDHELTHAGNKTLASHIGNDKRHPTNYDAVSIRKASKDSGRKIDAAVCAVMAYGLRQEYLNSKNYRTGKVGIYR